MSDLRTAFESLLAAPPAPAGLPAQTLPNGSLLAATVRSHLGAVQTRDGCWIAQAAFDGSTQLIAAATAAGGLVTALNVPGDQVPDLTGTLTLPLSVRPGDSVVLLTTGATSRPPVQTAQPSGVSEAMAVVFVGYPVSPDLYCPPVLGRRGNAIVDFLRGCNQAVPSGPIPEALIDWSRLPSVIDLDAVYGPGGIDEHAWGAARPTIAQAIANHRHFACDYPSDWRCAGRVPYTGHAGYGTNLSGNMSVAALLACSTLPLEQKKPLVHAICQRALHDWGRFGDGAKLMTDGGHAWGRRFGMILFGMLTGIEGFCDPRFLGNNMPEDQFTVSNSWWGEQGYLNYRHHWTNPPDMWSRPPSTWGDPSDPSHHAFAWAVKYGGQTIPALIGQALAVKLLGATKYAPQMVKIAEQFMQGPPASAKSQLTALGINMNWGGDFAVPTGFAAECWRRYAFSAS